jgi:uncharacterized protein YcgI (DUF1989 family)
MALSVSPAFVVIEPQTAVAVSLERGDVLHVGTTQGAQVADVALFARDDLRDSLSPGRTMDYNERLIPQIGDILFSHRSTPLATIVADSVGVHDLLLTPCSEAMFARRGELRHPSCHATISAALARYGLGPDDVIATFNAFMDVRVEGNRIVLYPPPNAPDGVVSLRAEVPLIAGISACSSELTNGGRCKPVRYAVSAGSVYPKSDA